MGASYRSPGDGVEVARPAQIRGIRCECGEQLPLRDFKPSTGGSVSCECNGCGKTFTLAVGR